jgi:tetratricopeptide (TPR) repeat protein
VGNHHILKGAKLWEWGPGEYGSVWDTEILTDEDGPYAELMVGGFSDNQPDYSWIRPGEVKRLKQYWYPVRNLGGFKKANLNAAVNLSLSRNNRITIGLNATQELHDCRVILEEGKDIIFDEVISLGPAEPYRATVTVKGKADLTRYKVHLVDKDYREIISYQEKMPEYEAELPDPVTPPLRPHEISTVEELVLTGQRIMQFHNPAMDPREYFLEAIGRDPMNSMANLHLGNLAAIAGRYDAAADYYRRSIQRISKDYTRPRDCEALYQLGVILKKQKKYEAAVDTLYRATWDQSWHAAAYLELAEISMIFGRFDRALEQLDHALATNGSNPKALALKSMVLRHLEERADAGITARIALQMDPLEHMAAFELLLANAIRESEFTTLLRGNKENYLELACAYLEAGRYTEAAGVLDLALQAPDSELQSYPILSYYRAWIAELQGEEELAEELYSRASSALTDYVFPYRFETIDILNAAINHDSTDAKAWYYLGNIYYDHQPGKALICWKKAVDLNGQLGIAHRNLGWGYYRYLHNIPNAIGHYETAVGLNPEDPRYYYELDVLYELHNVSPEKRLALFSEHPGVSRGREDAFLRKIEVLILNGLLDTALSHLSEHHFIRQEGVTRMHDLFVDAQLLKGRELLQSGDYAGALEHFLLADTYPSNQGIGRISNYRKEAQIYFFTGLAYQGLEEKSKARSFFKKATETPVGQSEYLYYRGLAQKELNQEEEARASARQLNQAGEEALEKASDPDFFAKFGERTGVDSQTARAWYLIALGHRLSCEDSRAKEAFDQALELRNSLLWARIYAGE